MYSLRKSKLILFHFAHRFKQKKRKLNASQKDQLQGLLSALQEALLQKERAKADQLAKKVQHQGGINLKKSGFEQVRDFLFALLVALFVAVIIRSLCFELYEIPSGSMRPTLQEQDRLIVSKTDFGLNIPLQAAHFMFDPNLVVRSGITIFTGANMDIRDVNTLYFYLFPGKKQFVKRIMGKPGDTLYFYGGQIYGIDSKGEDITEELQRKELAAIEHIPFIQFEGKVITEKFPLQEIYSPVIIEQMNEPVAKLFLTPTKQVKGEMLVPGVSDYGNLWGIKNFAQVRLLSKEQAKAIAPSQLSDAPYYLELSHTPSIKRLKLGRDLQGRYRPQFILSTSLLPLTLAHLKTLYSNLYTARFVVENGFARRWGATTKNHLFSPQLSGVPDGTYELSRGKGYKVLWQGITKELAPDHPLMQFDPKRLELLFNLGIEFDTRFSPATPGHLFYPVRYAYFKDGELYVMGNPLLKIGDAALEAFTTHEKERAAATEAQNSYLPFLDEGPPLKADGSLNKELIATFGLKIPAKKYLALGDNHAMSGDSRDFGFVPEDNLRGSPDFIFWPPGSRFGPPLQPKFALFTLPRLIVWAAGLIVCTLYLIIRARRRKLPLTF